jgi:hypothetical protein
MNSGHYGLVANICRMNKRGGDYFKAPIFDFKPKRNMTLLQKINELNELGFSVKFDKSTSEFERNNIVIKIRLHRVGSSVIHENQLHMTHDEFMSEGFLVDRIDKSHKEIERELFQT